MELGNYMTELVALSGGIIGSILSYKKGKGDAKSTELDNVVKAIAIWKDTAQDLSNKLEGVNSDLELLKKHHEDCEESKRKLEIKVAELDRKVCNIGK